MAQIATIETGNQPRLSAEASAESVRLLRELLVSHQAELHLRGEMTISDSLQAAARQEIYRAVEGIDKRMRLDTGANLPTLDYLLSTQNQRYVLVTATQGFTRTPNNYSGQVAKSIGVGVLTMGMMVPIAIKAKSIICLFIYDRQQKAIVYYNHTPPPAEREPLNQAVLERQLRTMLAKDFPLR
ncbi:hypothetical protein ACFP2F_20010 [Hymenobacter artigasi]|uniref:DUF4154 domain-containing protein n=1 Tax=Hymenobacter artigasi TaxID=2719616 RepID=A0ABX1HNL9_9BACT|nr:hypothetical protein [Hymenobacter artigasi]NKI91420.1 hypothetical protein [Hymenobacter artigasi]